VNTIYRESHDLHIICRLVLHFELFYGKINEKNNTAMRGNDTLFHYDIFLLAWE
jgi:hypothetical protein